LFDRLRSITDFVDDERTIDEVPTIQRWISVSRNYPTQNAEWVYKANFGRRQAYHRVLNLYQAVDQLRFQRGRVSSHPKDINKPSEHDDCPRQAAIPQGQKALGAAR
jgi:hypothetical protein